MRQEKANFLRYPGGKQRLLNSLLPYLPSGRSLNGMFVEPFVGSGAAFFALNPKRALLADINSELIDLYRGIRNYPLKVWKIFKSFPTTKKAYYKIRALNLDSLDLASRSARTLYLNRTCFKGMWRHNSNGEFNVGYGGQARRWAINKETLIEASMRLKYTSLKCSDFEEIIRTCTKGDFIFVDPPYRPGEREMTHAHYTHHKFSFDDHKRLAATLKTASQKKIPWAVTISVHPEILSLYRGNRIIPLPKGTGQKPGILTDKSGEVLICNYKEKPDERIF